MRSRDAACSLAGQAFASADLLPCLSLAVAFGWRRGFFLPEWDQAIERLAPLRARAAGACLDSNRARHGRDHVTESAHPRRRNRPRRWRLHFGRQLGAGNGGACAEEEGRVNDIAFPRLALLAGRALGYVKVLEADGLRASHSP